MLLVFVDDLKWQAFEDSTGYGLCLFYHSHQILSGLRQGQNLKLLHFKEQANNKFRILEMAHAGLQGGDRNICNMLLSSDLPLALVLCTNSKKPI